MKFQMSIGKLLALVSILFLFGAEGQAKATSKSEETKGSMHMDEMMTNMNECKSMHMDAKMCDHQMMAKCQKNMGKGECQKMMNQAKATSRTTKK